MRSSSLIDIILSKTQRKTPTIIRQQFSIQRIRNFYIRKLKFVQQKFDNYICKIIKSFPMVDQIHQFYNVLFNILFNKDYYKIALSRLNNSKIIVAKISTNYIRLLKHGDSLYSCKHLKKIALGRICTVVKKLDQSFIYLEKVRLQIKNIPTIDPYRTSILLAGCTNSGKSSLMNKMTKANVQVCSAIYTTKIIQTGHLIRNFVQWQIIDTPGLDSLSFSKYNSIEIQTINAFIYLDHITIYIFDPSNSIQFKLVRQIEQFKSVSVLIKKKKKIFLLGKTDLEWEKSKNREIKSYITSIFKTKSIKSDVLKLSSHDEVGLLSLCQNACDLDNNLLRKKHKQINPTCYISNRSNHFFNNLRIFQSTKKLSQKIQSIKLKQKNFFPVIIRNLENIPIKKIGSFIQIKSKNIEKEEKIREFIHEEKFIIQNLFYSKLSSKSLYDIAIFPNNTIVLNSTF